MSELSEKLENLLLQQTIVSKYDAAGEQLHTAIDLFFSGKEYLSQFTLVGASHGVLRDIGIRKGILNSFKDSPLIKDGERKEYLKTVNLAQNFLKHADKDPEAKLCLSYNAISIYILDAIVMWVALGNELTFKMKVVLFWVQLSYPELIKFKPAEEYIASLRVNLFTVEEKMEFCKNLYFAGENITQP